MKNYWLDRKKCEKRWKRIELHSNNCFLIMKETPMVPWDKTLKFKGKMQEGK